MEFTTKVCAAALCGVLGLALPASAAHPAATKLDRLDGAWIAKGTPKTTILIFRGDVLEVIRTKHVLNFSTPSHLAQHVKFDGRTLGFSLDGVRFTEAVVSGTHMTGSLNAYRIPSRESVPVPLHSSGWWE